MLTSTCDVPQNWQVNIQDPASPSLEGMITFHEYLMFFLLQIGVAVCWYLWKNKQNVKIFLFTHDSTLEVYWTVLPAFILLFIAVPSFILLYSLDDVVNPNLTIKVTGHQWFWSYEYGDACIRRNELLLANLSFDSYLVSTADLIAGQLRLLEVDQRLIIPTNTHVRLLICSGDVLHSWAVPSLGIKLDACPGRVSEANLFIKRPGVYYGQCSEICGTNHGFMPIVVRAVPYVDFMNWWMAREANLASSQKGLSQAVLSNLWLDTVSVESDSAVSAVATLFSFKKFRVIKNKISAFGDTHVVSYKTPFNLSYLWSFGAIAGILLVSMILSGTLLAMHYSSTMQFAFSQVEHIMNDVSYGPALRYCHANGASVFFFVVYLHMLKAIFFWGICWRTKVYMVYWINYFYFNDGSLK